MEALLAGGVPDCQVERRSVHGYALRQVRSLNGGGLRVGEHVGDVTQQQRRLANTACRRDARAAARSAPCACEALVPHTVVPVLQHAPSPRSTTL